MPYAVAFDGWDFESHGVIVSSLSLQFEESSEPAKSAWPDHSASSEASMSGNRIVMSGTIAADGGDADDLHDKYSALLEHTRGADRSKRGELSVYSGRHYWAQRLGTPQVTFEQGSPSLSWQLTFYADDPHSRSDTRTTLAETTSSTDPNVEIAFGSDFDGNASRIPIVITSGLGWQAGEVLRVHNADAGWRCEVVVGSTLPASTNIVLDGELHEFVVAGEVQASGVAGTFPYLLGGISNTLDFSGSDRHGAVTIAFTDRWQG